MKINCWLIQAVFAARLHSRRADYMSEVLLLFPSKNTIFWIWISNFSASFEATEMGLYIFQQKILWAVFNPSLPWSWDFWKVGHVLWDTLYVSKHLTCDINDTKSSSIVFSFSLFSNAILCWTWKVLSEIVKYPETCTFSHSLHFWSSW